jgi:FkbM family methyltransferase
MHNYILKGLNAAIHKLTKKKLLVIDTESNYNTAAQSSMGFWYAGNVFDAGDIAYGIARNGQVEKFETDTVKKILSILPENYIFFDIGANTGYYGIMSSFLHPNSYTHSFEPIPNFSQKIRETIELNRLSNINVHTHAVGSSNETKHIYLSGSGTTFIPEFTGISEKDAATTKVQIIPLDTIVNQIKSVPHFIKIDVEGFELEVLKGGIQSLAQKPIIFVEIADTIRRKGFEYTHPTYSQTIETLTRLGYEGYVLHNDAYIPIQKKTKDVGIAMYLFLNRNTHSNVYSALNLQ